MAMKRLSMVVAGGRITPLRLRAAAAPGCSFPPVVSCAARRQDHWQVTSDTVGYARISLNYYGKNHI